MNSRAILVLRWIPFVTIAALSLWVAGGFPQARKPFEVDFTLSRNALGVSLGKLPHYESTALLFALAAVALGACRPWSAFSLTMLVGVGWEIAETTAPRHHARVADLAPDLVAAFACVAVLLAAREAVAGVRRRRTRGESTQDA